MSSFTPVLIKNIGRNSLMLEEFGFFGRRMMVEVNSSFLSCLVPLIVSATYLNSKAIELYDKIFKNYEYIEPPSIESEKAIPLNQSYVKENLFLFEESLEDSDMEVDC
uniref:Transmembrane protein n=1 Tax=Strongyloides venezuelensis TaxID=75913 RepID=A0A0K0FBC9_STRVS